MIETITKWIIQWHTGTMVHYSKRSDVLRYSHVCIEHEPWERNMPVDAFSRLINGITPHNDVNMRKELCAHNGESVRWSYWHNITQETIATKNTSSVVRYANTRRRVIRVSRSVLSLQPRHNSTPRHIESIQVHFSNNWYINQVYGTLSRKDRHSRRSNRRMWRELMPFWCATKFWRIATHNLCKRHQTDLWHYQALNSSIPY